MKTNLFVLFLLFSLSSVTNAEVRPHNVFAVDLSLSVDERAIAFDIIREATLSTTGSVGLTLFDDTVRGYNAPLPLDQKQLDVLDQAMVNAPKSVRTTSNMAVGIERSIDAYAPVGGANLIVFSRGVIDTQTSDPRAKFNQWLDVVLLPQAIEQGVDLTLIVFESYTSSDEIQQAFQRNSGHQIIQGDTAKGIFPELAALLDIPNRTYGAITIAENDITNEDTSIDQGESLQVENLDNTTQAVVPEDLNVEISESISNALIAKIVLLLLACFALAAMISSRRKGRKIQTVSEPDVTKGSTTYLPLSTNPGRTMGNWIPDDTGAKVQSTGTTSRSDTHGSSTNTEPEPVELDRTRISPNRPQAIKSPNIKIDDFDDDMDPWES